MSVIQFNGKIIAPATSIDDLPSLKTRSVQEAVSSAPVDMTINLPTEMQTAFHGKGSFAGTVAFSLELNPLDADVVQVTFTGPASGEELLATQNSTVGIGLLDMLSRSVKIGTPVYYWAEPSRTSLEFYAGYIQVSDAAVESGDISASANVEIKYLKYIE